jgi:hypothetical protein
MTNDQLANAFADLFTEAHTKVGALDDGQVKTTATRLLSMFHHAGEVFAAHAVDNSLIQPMDGTNKPPGP